ncbi:MAG: ZrgA family zinc uptake protein, partial [Pseudomonadales bacterium]
MQTTGPLLETLCAGFERVACFVKATFSCLLITLLAADTSLAAPESGSRGAHTHGVAELTLALEGQEVEIVFTAPAISVVGFEYKASSPEQREAVAQARSKLLTTTSLFSFGGTDCALQHANIDVSAVLTEEKAHHGEDLLHEESHTNISAHYEYQCSDSAALETIIIGTNGLPFGLEAINAMWVS